MKYRPNNPNTDLTTITLMYRATRTFIAARQPHTKYVVETVRVRQLGTKPKNCCFQNATDDGLMEQGFKAVSGWLIGPYCSATKSTEIIAHWWNIDPTGTHIDLTSGVESDCEYVVDSSIAEVGQQMYDRLDDLVACSLLLKENKFFSIEKVDGNIVSNQILSLDTRTLLRLR